MLEARVIRSASPTRSGQTAADEIFFKADRRRDIDRYIDYFGDTQATDDHPEAVDVADGEETELF